MIINLLPEAERLHALGFAIHWLHPHSKAPLFPGWTSGPRTSLKDLRTIYKKRMNVGVRLGHASKLSGDTFLAVVDVDVKSDDPRHRAEAEKALSDIFPEVLEGPHTLSGRGNGSAHYYLRLKTPVSGDECKAHSHETVKVLMPSVAPGKKEEMELTFEELAEGYRIRRAWEVSLLSEGRQCVLPGSVHPDTGHVYQWGKGIDSPEDIPLLETVPKGSKSASKASKGSGEDPGITSWEFIDVDVDQLGLNLAQVDAIKTGAGVSDCSAKVFELTLALLSRGVADQTIMSLFTDRQWHLGQTAYQHAQTRNRKYAARWLEKYCLRKAKLKIDDTDFDLVDEPSDSAMRKAKVKPEIPAEVKQILWPVGLSQPLKVWEKQLVLKPRGKTKSPLVASSYSNLILILQNSCESAKFLRMDQFSLNARYTCDTPWGIKKNQQRSADAEDALLVKAWLHRKYEMVPSVSLIEEILNTETVENVFHPVKDYLLPLHHDGVPRIATAFRDYLGASMPEPYLSEVSKKFFIGAVKRIMEPGSTFQYMVVLEGKQGIGKSTAISILASKPWFLDNLPHLQEKDASLYLLGTWLCEVAELTALARTDSGAAKAFISRDTDRIRPPFGKRRIDYPRSTLFIGTTNQRDYLTDPTGNRRYWPVLCHKIDLEGLQRDRDQLWAEAMSEYFWTPEKLYLEGKALRQAEVIQEMARSEDEIDLMVDEFKNWEAECIKEKASVPTKLKMSELFKSAWGMFKSDNRTMQKGAHAMRQLGYEKRRSHGSLFWSKKESGV